MMGTHTNFRVCKDSSFAQFKNYVKNTTEVNLCCIFKCQICINVV